MDQEEPRGDHEKPHRETERFPQGRGKIKFYVHQEVPRGDREEPHGETKRNLMVTMRNLTVRPRGSLLVGERSNFTFTGRLLVVTKRNLTVRPRETSW